MRQLHRAVVGPGVHRRVDLLGRPAEHPLRELRRLLDADAAVAERAHVLVEQVLRRRVVQVDVEVVREEELHEAERVLPAGTLADVRLASVAVRLHVLGVEVAGVRLHLRPDLLRGDVVGDVPVRAEDDELHRVRERRRRLVLVVLADDDLHVEHLLAAVVRLELERGHVDPDVAAA